MSQRSPASLFAARPELACTRIRRLGFRRWLERELIAGHGWLVLCFLAMIAVAAAFELLSIGGGIAEFMIDALLIAGAGWVGWHAWGRYRHAMELAGTVSEQAVCGQCGHYGFRPGEAQGVRLQAACPKCDHHWWVSAGPGQDQTRP
jgi:hypothetical protein